MNVDVDAIKDINVFDASNINSQDVSDSLMRSIKYPKYDFICDDDKYIKNNGFCVRDNFVGKYSPKIKKLNEETYYPFPFHIEVKGNLQGIATQNLIL